MGWVIRPPGFTSSGLILKNWNVATNHERTSVCRSCMYYRFYPRSFMTITLFIRGKKGRGLCLSMSFHPSAATYRYRAIMKIGTRTLTDGTILYSVQQSPLSLGGWAPRPFLFLVHGQVTIIFVVSVCLCVCFFVQSFSQPSLIRFRSNLDICYMSGSRCVL